MTKILKQPMMLQLSKSEHTWNKKCVSKDYMEMYKNNWNKTQWMTLKQNGKNP